MSQYKKNISNQEKLESPIDFRSDTVTLPSHEMLASIDNTKLGDDVYGEDIEVIELQEYAANLLGKEASLFFPSGTQSNLTAMLAHCQRGDEVLIGRHYHTNVYEARGVSVLGGVGICPIDTSASGSMKVSDMLSQIKDNDPSLCCNKTSLFREHFFWKSSASTGA